MLPGAMVPYNSNADWNTKRWMDFRKGLGAAELEELMDVIVERVKKARLFRTVGRTSFVMIRNAVHPLLTIRHGVAQ